MCPTGTTLNPAAVDATSDFRGAFAIMDVDRDGKISGDDLRSFYETVSSGSSGPSREHDDTIIRAMINVADANKDGYVQYDEFKGVLDVREGVNNNNVDDDDDDEDGGVMKEVFRAMDSDGDGRLGVDDLRNYLELIGIKVNDDEISVMIKLGGGNVCDGVSFHGFLNILALH